MSNAPEHLMIAERLNWLPNYAYGTQDIALDKIDAVNRWMDHFVWPVERGGNLGQIIQSEGVKVTPLTHRMLGHDALRVGRVFSGDGSHDPNAAAVAGIHNQVDSSELQKWMLNQGLPGINQLAAAGLMYAIGKGIYSSFDNIAKYNKGELTLKSAITNISKDAGIGTADGIAKLIASAAINKAVISTGSELLINISQANGAMVAGFTLLELGKDIWKLSNGKIAIEDVFINTGSNITKSVCALYTAKIGAAIGIVGGPIGVAAGAIIGAVVGGVITDVVIKEIIQTAKMKPEDFIKPLTESDLKVVINISNSFRAGNLFINEVGYFIVSFHNSFLVTEVLDSQLRDLGSQMKSTLN